MIRLPSLRRLCACLALTVATPMAIAQSASSSSSAGTSYPERPIRLLLGQAAGGAVDTIARMLAERLGATLRQPVVVENRPGAGAMIAAEAVARAPADGYTLALLDEGALTVNPVLQKKIAYDVLKDFSYLGTVARIPLVMVAHPSLNVATSDELTRYSKAHPSALSYASAGVGSPPHLAFEAYKQQSGAIVAHLPYRGGAPALADVVAGHVHLTFIDTNLGSQYAKTGRVKPIAVSTRQRSPLLPAVPTFEEAGLKGFEFAPWVGVVGPAGLPAPVAERIAQALQTVLADRDLLARVRGSGFEPFASGSTAFAALIRQDLEARRTLIRERNIRLEN
ncbi:tripartite tricarboxylate transporter substrate binding protein [Cupriavidus gilardii]|nr:tripartite tricarboxylate transporter substrate binding protein [Cupriavidus gilardii]